MGYAECFVLFVHYITRNNFIDTWKGIKRINRYIYSITDFADILAKEMLEQTCQLQVSTDLFNNEIEYSDSNSCHAKVSPITAYTGDKQKSC